MPLGMHMQFCLRYFAEGLTVDLTQLLVWPVCELCYESGNAFSIAGSTCIPALRKLEFGNNPFADKIGDTLDLLHNLPFP